MFKVDNTTNSEETISFKIPNLKNPRTMEPTGRFLIRILDSEKNTIISNKAQSLVASMTKVSAFKSFVMQATKNIGNGDINSFFIETDFDLDEEDMQYGDKLVFDLPAELSVVGDLKCYG